jgi:hypothetical protein
VALVGGFEVPIGGSALTRLDSLSNFCIMQNVHKEDFVAFGWLQKYFVI